MSDKLINNFDLSFKQNYLRVNLYSNLFFLNKKIYLLYNFWNKKSSFFLLNKNKFFLNFQELSSLNFFKYLKKEKKNFDYFFKWNGRFCLYAEPILKNLFNNKNKKKQLINLDKSLDYMVFDSLYDKYIINKKNNIFYFFKNKQFLNFYLRLKQKTMKFKLYNYFFLYNNYINLNNNYMNILILYNWKSNFIYNKYYLFFNHIKLSLKKKIMQFIFFFKLLKIKNNILNYMHLHFLNKKLFVKPLSLYSYKSNKCLSFSNNFKNYFFNIFYKKSRKKKFHLKYKKKIPFFFQKKFMSGVGHNIYKNLKKRIFFSKLHRIDTKKKSYERNFYELKKFLYNPIFEKKKEKRIIKKKKKLRSFRLLKKLKTFIYYPGSKKTRKAVFKRFKRSSILKLRKRKEKKRIAINFGKKFNFSVYNKRNRYKNRLKVLASEKKKIPYYFFFKKKIFKKKIFKKKIFKKKIFKTNIFKTKNINRAIKQLSFKWISYRVAKKCRIKFKPRYLPWFKKKQEIKKKQKIEKKQALNLKYGLKKKLYIFFLKIKEKKYKEFKKGWLLLYKNRSKKFKHLKLFEYIKYLKNIINTKVAKIKKKNYKKFEKNKKKFNLLRRKKKKMFWFFQKYLLYWKNLIKFKKFKSPVSLVVFNHFRIVFSKIYKSFFLINLKLLRNFFFNFYEEYFEESLYFFLCQLIKLITHYKKLLISLFSLSFKKKVDVLTYLINRYRIIKKKKKLRKLRKLRKLKELKELKEKKKKKWWYFNKNKKNKAPFPNFEKKPKNEKNQFYYKPKNTIKFDEKR